MALGLAMAQPPAGMTGLAGRDAEVLHGHGGLAPALVLTTRGDGCGPLRLGRHLEAGLDEAVAQELLGVVEGQAPRLRSQDDQEEALTLAPCRDGEVVARLAGETRLERLYPAGILEEGDAAAMHTAAVHEARPAQKGARGGIVLDEEADKPRHVLGCRALVGIGEAVGVGEVSGAQR